MAGTPAPIGFASPAELLVAFKAGMKAFIPAFIAALPPDQQAMAQALFTLLEGQLSQWIAP